jgi:hypothetical protein
MHACYILSLGGAPQVITFIIEYLGEFQAMWSKMFWGINQGTGYFLGMKKQEVENLVSQPFSPVSFRIIWQYCFAYWGKGWDAS